MCEDVLRRRVGLCLLCGLPGSGKSTLTQMLRSGGCEQQVVVVTYDDIITADDFSTEPRILQCGSREISSCSDTATEEEAGEPTNQNATTSRKCIIDSNMSTTSTLPAGMAVTETSYWKQHRRYVLEFVEQLLVALLSSSALKGPSCTIKRLWNHFVQCLKSQDIISSAGSDVETSQHVVTIPENQAVYLVLDDNFFYQSMRYEVYQLARKYSLGFCQLYLHCALECCLQRNRTRPYPVSDKTICLMEKKIEKPNPEKNPWEQNSLSMDTSNQVRITEIIDLFNYALDNPLSPLLDDREDKDKDRAICAANVHHQADQSLRRLISDTMKTVKGTIPAQDAKLMARDLQNIKSKLLDNLRQSMFKRSLSHSTKPIPDLVSLFKEQSDQILQTYLCKQDKHISTKVL